MLVYLSLLCEIYRDKGYYLRLDDSLIPDIADTCGIAEELAGEIVSECVEVGLFDRGLYDRERVITSQGIQCRYCDILAGLRRKGGIDADFCLISSEGIGNSTEEIRGITQDAEDCRISSDKKREDKKRENKNSDTNIDTHTEILRKEVQEETIPPGEAAPVPPPEWDTLRDCRAVETFGRPWRELDRAEQMYLWAAHYYPLMFQFSRPLTLENCKSILARVPDYTDVDRIFDAISNRKNIIAEKVSAISTFYGFARMDTILKGKQKV